jgi:hypothetical protein
MQRAALRSGIRRSAGRTTAHVKRERNVTRAHERLKA